jgi:hypothetical protein
MKQTNNRKKEDSYFPRTKQGATKRSYRCNSESQQYCKAAEIFEQHQTKYTAE